MYDIELILVATMNTNKQNKIEKNKKTKCLFFMVSVAMQLLSNEVLTGVMHAKMNNGADERPKSQRHPKVGATANAKATSKQAPRAQKH